MIGFSQQQKVAHASEVDSGVPSFGSGYFSSMYFTIASESPILRRGSGQV